MKLTLIADNAKPEKAPKTRRLPKVAPYCPACGSNRWIWVNEGPADRVGAKVNRLHGCWHCKHVW